MRISPIRNFSQRNNVSFGRFKDDNAKKVVSKALVAKPSMWYMQDCYNGYFNTIDKCDFFEAYTDEDTGEVKGRFTDEFVRNIDNNTPYAQSYIKNMLEDFKDYGTLDDLSTFDNIEDAAHYLWNFKEVLKGVDLSECCKSKNPYGDRRAQDYEDEERIRNLAD